MSKLLQTRQKILEEVQNHGPISSGDIAKSLSVTRMTVYSHLQALLEDKAIKQSGEGKATVYYRPSNNKHVYTEKFLGELKDTIVQSYQLNNEFTVEGVLNKSVALEQPDGRILLGLEALYEKIKKEFQKKSVTDEDFMNYCISYFDEYFSFEIRRRASGLFEGTQSLKKIMQDYDEKAYVDELYFCEPGMLPRFGRSATSIYLGLGKERSSKILLNRAIDTRKESIMEFIRTKPTDYIVFAPPTIERKFQFREVLRESLEKVFPLPPILKAEKKIKIEDGFYIAQKRTKGKDRIINARESMEVLPTGEQDIKKAHHILIFDDNFTTGSTVNFLAEKIRQLRFTGVISSINITGAFYYEPGVTDEADI